MPAIFTGIRFDYGANTDTNDADGDYDDVSDDVRGIVIEMGKSRELEAYRPSTASVILDNRARAYDPLNLAGPNVSGGVTQVTPGRRLRIKATHPTTSTVYSLFNGIIRQWDLGYNRTDATTTARASDQLTDLAGINITKTTSSGLSSVAVGEIMTEAGITRYDAQTGKSSLQSTAFVNQPVLTALLQVEDSEQGAVYCSTDGRVQVDNRHAILTETRSKTSQATFGSGNLTISEIEIEYASDLIKNDITATRAGGVAQNVQDATSIAAYAKHSYALSSMMISTDAGAADVAQYLLAVYKSPEVRIRSITLDPQRHADLMTQALARELRDRVTVTYAPPGGGSAITQEVFIAGIRHEFTAGRMRTKFTFESTTYRGGFWILGTSTLGETTVLGF